MTSREIVGVFQGIVPDYYKKGYRIAGDTAAAYCSRKWLCSLLHLTCIESRKSPSEMLNIVVAAYPHLAGLRDLLPLYQMRYPT